jgi:hypothetical protein
MPDQPKFARFVSPVPGRLVSRWDVPGSYLGARVTTTAERLDGAPPILWDEDAVIPLTEQFCARYGRELHNAFRHGDLEERTADDWTAWLAHQQELEAPEPTQVEEEN